MHKLAATRIGGALSPSIALGTVVLVASIGLLGGCSPLAAGLAATSDATMLAAANWGGRGAGYRSVQKNVPAHRGVDVSLLPYNWRAARDSKYFSVAVEFSSDPGGPRSIDADFRRFTLNMPDGSVVRPIGYALTYPGVVSQGCRNGGGENGLPPSEPRTVYDIHPFPDAPIRIRSNAWSKLSECYDLIFPVATLAPESTFSINVAGIAIDGMQMREEKVRFARGPGR